MDNDVAGTPTGAAAGYATPPAMPAVSAYLAEFAQKRVNLSPFVNGLPLNEAAKAMSQSATLAASFLASSIDTQKFLGSQPRPAIGGVAAILAANGVLEGLEVQIQTQWSELAKTLASVQQTGLNLHASDLLAGHGSRISKVFAAAVITQSRQGLSALVEAFEPDEVKDSGARSPGTDPVITETAQAVVRRYVWLWNALLPWAWFASQRALAVGEQMSDLFHGHGPKERTLTSVTLGLAALTESHDLRRAVAVFLAFQAVFMVCNTSYPKEPDAGPTSEPEAL